jgi:arylsulfatase A-like enzyme
MFSIKANSHPVDREIHGLIATSGAVSAGRVHFAGNLAAILLPLAALLAALPGRARGSNNADGATRPNVVLVFVDNFGNGDLGCFGSTLHRTPHVDRLAAEGTKFTSFYVGSGVCTPSRASLMTGCYPRRVNLHVSDTNGAVLQPVSPKGLNPDEVTIAEVLGQAGYATACFGKWHLGDQPAFLPGRQGFDAFFGIPYSDDMTRDKRPDRWPELPLLRDGRVVEAPVDRHTLVKRCTEEAVAFIERNRDRPFFLYLPLTSPGSTPEPFASEAFRGKSRNGAYGDAVEELDWSTGEIMAALARSGLDRQTLVIWTSDNGAARRNPPQGSCAPYRGFGYDTSEGAMRMPCVIRWPGKVPADRVCDELLGTLDLLPTLAALAGAPLPANRIDGHAIAPVLFGDAGARSPWDEEGFLFYFMEQLQAVRSGPWKLYLALDAKFVNLARKSAPSRLELYDVRHDPGETREVSAEHPEVVRRLDALVARARRELGDMDRPGEGQRPAGRVEEPRPLIP